VQLYSPSTQPRNPSLQLVQLLQPLLVRIHSPFHAASSLQPLVQLHSPPMQHRNPLFAALAAPLQPSLVQRHSLFHAASSQPLPLQLHSTVMQLYSFPSSAASQHRASVHYCAALPPLPSLIPTSCPSQLGLPLLTPGLLNPPLPSLPPLPSPLPPSLSPFLSSLSPQRSGSPPSRLFPSPIFPSSHSVHRGGTNKTRSLLQTAEARNREPGEIEALRGAA